MTDRRGPDPWFFDLWSRFYDGPLVQRFSYRPGHDAVLRELQPTGTVGCDFSDGMLHQAAHKYPELPLVRGNARQLPFADERFSAVVSTESFHWFPDQDTALAGFYRVLAPKGRLLVALVNPPVEWLSRATRLGSKLIGEPLRWPTRPRLRRQFEAAGFRVDSQRAVFRLPAPFIFPCVLTVATRPG